MSILRQKVGVLVWNGGFYSIYCLRCVGHSFPRHSSRVWPIREGVFGFYTQNCYSCSGQMNPDANPILVGTTEQLFSPREELCTPTPSSLLGEEEPEAEPFRPLRVYNFQNNGRGGR